MHHTSEQTLPITMLAPGPRGLPLIGSTLDVLRDMPTFLLRAHRAYGDIVRIKTAQEDMILLAHPRHIAYVLQENPRNYPKSRFYDALRPLLGNGLLTNQGESWLRQRRLMQPAFHRNRLAEFATTMTEQSEALAQQWARLATTNGEMDVAQEMMRLTLSIVGRTLFSVDLTSSAQGIGRAVTAALNMSDQRMNSVVQLPAWLPTPANRRFGQAMNHLDALVATMIAKRRAEASKPDVLSMLLDARDADTGAAMDDQQVRDEVLTLLVAGHETTANGLAWTWYLLAKHPDVERRLAAELADVLGGRTPTIEDLPKLRYTTMVVDEALRLYPPAWVIDRQVLHDDVLDGYHLPAGAIVLLSQYVTHRHPAVWEQPAGFDPERFAPENAEGRPKLAHFPFGAGKHICIGAQFALMEMQLILATLVQRFRLDLVPGHPVEAQAQVTLRPRHGILVTVRGKR